MNLASQPGLHGRVSIPGYEFLCPIDSLRLYLGDEFLPEAFEDAAEHFGISEMAIKSHLANHHLIPPTLVDPDTLS
jgi:hypothetical protein